MSKTDALLLQYLEGVSWRILEAYPEAVRELIRRRAGVYALYRGRKLYYVGLASNLMGRINNHLRDRHHGSWDKFSVYLTQHHEHMKELEALLLRIVRPAGNTQSGRFAGSQSLLSSLNHRMTEIDADRRARLLGGNVAKRRARSKARAGGPRSLRGIFERRKQLRGRRSGRQFRASLLQNGTIRYRNRVFRSPSAAARAAVKGPVNGWSFWLYQDDESGTWVPLKSLGR